MFENIRNIFKKGKKKELLKSSSKDTAKERLHLVLMQDRANVSADFLDLMRREIIEVIKKYIDIDEEAMDVRLTTETNEDGVQGAPALYANIPIINIKDETRQLNKDSQESKIQIEPPKIEKENANETKNEIIEDTKENIENSKDKKTKDEKTKEVIQNLDNEQATNELKEKNENEIKEEKKNEE